jgi:peptide/nickel transport system substrate-binding protein
LIPALIGFVGISLIVIVFFALVWTGSQRVQAAQQAQNPIVYGLTLLPTTFDPYVGSSSELGIALRSVYDTLVYRDPLTRQFVPGLAAKTEISSDGLTYTFTLRQDVTFQDSTPFDSHAVAKMLDRVTDPKTHSQKAVFLLGPYDHYTVVDPYTIQIVLKQPYAPLLDGLAQVYLGIASPKALNTYDIDLYQFHQVGTGPFILTDYIPGDHLTLRRNPAYKWGPSFYHIPTDHAVDQITFRFFTDPATRAPALESAEAQVMGELSPTDATLFAGNAALKLYPQAVPGMPLQFLFNVTQAPTDQLAIRQALIQATNRAAIVDAVFQQFSPVAYGPLNAVTPAYDKRVQTLYPFDAVKALNALNGLGYTIPAGQKTLSLSGKPLHVVMIVPPWGFHPDVAQQIQSQWRELGIDVELRQVASYGALLAAQKAGDYNLIAVNDFGVDSSLLSRFYSSAALPSWTHYQNADLDAALSQGAQTLDPAQQLVLYGNAQQQIMQQALVLPIRDYVNLNGASVHIGQLSYDAYGWFPLLANLTYNATPS